MKREELLKTIRRCRSTEPERESCEKCPLHVGHDDCVDELLRRCETEIVCLEGALKTRDAEAKALATEVAELKKNVAMLLKEKSEMGAKLRKKGFEECEPKRVLRRLEAERLPENDDLVLVTFTGRIENREYIRAYLLASYHQREGWILEEEPDLVNPNIGHWMPLPEPPGTEVWGE